MTVNSDISLNANLFAASAIPPETTAFNEKLINIMKGAPKWYEVGAQKYREMRARGETPLPAAVHLESAETSAIPSRESGRDVPCRIFRPQDGKPIKAVFLHIHGGGWVLQDEASQDSALQAIADSLGLLVLSVGYRLAPEHPFPAGPEDCYDAAEWLVDNAEKKFGAPLAFVGGESAGAHLSALVAIHLLQSSKKQYSSFQFKGLLLHFGAYDLTFTPQAYNFVKPVPLVLDMDLMVSYSDACLPGMSLEDKKHPSISPLYADLYGLRLPSALFTCGTQDCLLDDTIFMSTKWMMAGGEAVVKIVPGGAHGYIMFPEHSHPAPKQGMDATRQYVRERL